MRRWTREPAGYEPMEEGQMLPMLVQQGSRPVTTCAAWVGAVIAVVALIVIVIGLIAVRSQLPALGQTVLDIVRAILALIQLIIFLFKAALIVGPILGIAWVIKKLLHVEVIEVGQHGGYTRTWLGRVRPLAPLTPVTPKQAARAGSDEISGPLPSLVQLLKENALFEGDKVMLGYRQDRTPRYGERARGTVGIVGEGDVGKSSTMEMEIIIALLQGDEVTVCDPHKTKDRSIWRKLRPLEPWITFAFTEEQIKAASVDFSIELERRKGADEQGYGQGYGQAQGFARRLLVYDEFKSIVKFMPKISEDVVKCVEIATDQGMGYEMGVLLACHGLKEEEIGQTSVREAFKAAWIHRIDGNQSKFALLGDRKFYSKTKQLPKGHVYYRDDEAMIEYLIRPLADMKAAEETARLLIQIGIPPTSKIVDGSVTRRPLPEQRAQHIYNAQTLPMPAVRPTQAQSLEDLQPRSDPVDFAPGWDEDEQDEPRPAIPANIPLNGIPHTQTEQGNILTFRRGPSISSQEMSTSSQETALEADGMEAGNGFPISGGNEKPAKNEVEEALSTISEEKREMLRRMAKYNVPLGDIAKILGLAGRKYYIFQALCQQEGIKEKGA